MKMKIFLLSSLVLLCCCNLVASSKKTNRKKLPPPITQKPIFKFPEYVNQNFITEAFEQEKGNTEVGGSFSFTALKIL